MFQSITQLIDRYYSFKSKMITSLIIMLICFIGVCNSIKAGDVYSGNYLPYQAHSFNDLDYFINLFKKGTKYYKIDVSLADRQSCQQFSNWNSSQQPACTQYAQYAYEICCLGLRGDASSQPRLMQPFNTTSNFVGMIKDRLLGNQQYQNRSIFIAMNLQFRFYFDNGIIQHFINQLTQLMADFKGRLDIGFGEDFILQYDKICLAKHTFNQTFGNIIPLQYQTQDQSNASTEIQCTKQRLQASKTPYFLQSSSQKPYDSRDIFKRYRNFNTFFRDAEHFCKVGFPQWIKKYPEYPLIFWQPSNQKQIQWILETVLSPSCVLKHGRGIQGIAIASNIDPEMLSNYMLKFRNNSDGFWDDEEQKIFIQSKRGVIASTQDFIFVGISQQDGVCYLNAYRRSMKIGHTDNNKLQITKIALQQLTEPGQMIAILSYNERMNGISTIGVVIETAQPTVKNKAHYIGVNHLKGEAQSLFASYQTILIYEFTTVSDKVLKTQLSVTNFIAGRIVGNQKNQRMLYILRLNIEQDYNIFLFNIDNQQSSVWKTFSLDFRISDFLIADQNGEQMMLFFGDDGQRVKLATMIVRNKTFIQTGRFITYGSKPKAAQYQQQISIVVQNSMCQSAILANNNQINKCRIPINPLYKNLTNVPSIINKLTVTVKELLNFSETDFPFSACSLTKQKSNMAKVFQGRNSGLTYFEGKVYFTSQFVPISSQGLFNGIFCGGSNYKNQNKGYYLLKMRV